MAVPSALPFVRRRILKHEIAGRNDRSQNGEMFATFFGNDRLVQLALLHSLRGRKRRARMKKPVKSLPSLAISMAFRFEAAGLPKLLAASLTLAALSIRLFLFWKHGG